MVIIKTQNRRSNNIQKTSAQSYKTQIKILPFSGQPMLVYLSADIICSSKLSFSRATLSENCSLLGTDNVRGQIS